MKCEEKGLSIWMAVEPFCELEQLREEVLGEFSLGSIKAKLPGKHPGRCQGSEEKCELETNFGVV